MSQPDVATTIELIKGLHENQTDYTGTPYWQHPVAVMHLLPPVATEDERIAALLHDVLEDTSSTADDLRALGYGETVLEIVELVTRRPEKGTYMEWVRSIATSGNVGAIRVKLADNLHNSDPARIGAIQDPDKREKMEQAAQNRYARSIRVLSAALTG